MHSTPFSDSRWCFQTFFLMFIHPDQNGEDETILTWAYFSGQIIVITPKGSREREIPLFQGNLFGQIFQLGLGATNHQLASL